jgi:hypothetical protein
MGPGFDARCGEKRPADTSLRLSASACPFCLGPTSTLRQNGHFDPAPHAAVPAAVSCLRKGRDESRPYMVLGLGVGGGGLGLLRGGLRRWVGSWRCAFGRRLLAGAQVWWGMAVTSWVRIFLGGVVLLGGCAGLKGRKGARGGAEAQRGFWRVGVLGMWGLDLGRCWVWCRVLRLWGCVWEVLVCGAGWVPVHWVPLRWLPEVDDQRLDKVAFGAAECPWLLWVEGLVGPFRHGTGFRCALRGKAARRYLFAP